MRPLRYDRPGSPHKRDGPNHPAASREVSKSSRKSDIVPGRKLGIVPGNRPLTTPACPDTEGSLHLSRRSVIRTGLLAAAAPLVERFGVPAFGAPANTQPHHWRHGLSLFGDLKYPAGFKHFDYVNPRAPKAGTARMGGFGSFDNFNMAVSGVKGALVGGITFIYDPLMADALDEVSTEYGLLAEAVSYPPDFSAVTYRLRSRGEVARRQAGDGRGRDLHARCIQEASSAICRLLPACDQGRADGRARGHLHVRRSRQSRIAADRRPALRDAETLVGRNRRFGQEARYRRDDARAAARQRRLTA